jgi:hypothetical protein
VRISGGFSIFPTIKPSDMPLDANTPLQVALQLIQGITWPAVIGAAYSVGRFFYKAGNKLETFSEQISEIHKTVTNDMKHSTEETLQLLRKQDSRFENWMVTQAAVAKQAHAHHGD